MANEASFVSTKLWSNMSGNNYWSWKEQMLCLVESRGLVGFIDGSAPPPPRPDDVVLWRRNDDLVKGWILGALSEEVLQIVPLLNTARDVWLFLEYKFSTASQPPPQPLPPHQQDASPPPPSSYPGAPPPPPWLLSSYPDAPPPPPPPPSSYPDAPQPLTGNSGKDWNEYLPLYKAAMNGDWDTTREILLQDPTAISARVSFTLETALHVAVGSCKSTSFVEKLVGMSDDATLAITLTNGYNPLHVAAVTGNLEAAKILVGRLPALLYVPNNTVAVGFPVHFAAECGHRETLEFLISITRDDLPVNPFAGDNGLVLLNLLIVAGFLDIALNLVNKYPYLARINSPNFPTALNVIAAKYTSFLVEVPLNFCDRFLHSLPGMKIYEKKLMRKQARELVKCICRHMESLNHEEASSIYRIAMRNAALAGSSEVVEEIVATFPSAIHSQDRHTSQNFLHLAVRNRCEKVYNLMYQTTNHRYHYYSTIDSSGNSILHMAAFLAPPHKLNSVSGAALQMQRELQWFKEVHKFITPFIKGRINNDGKTPEMLFTEEHRELKVEGEKWMKDTANSCTIAAALIVTVVFAAAITVPGGNESDTGYPMMWKNSAFTIFAVSDAVSLFTSATSLLMFLSILTSRYAEQDFLYALPKRLCIGLVTLFLSILFMMVAFSSTLYLVFGRKNAWVLIPVAALTCLPISSFVLLQFPLLIAVVSSTYGKGIFGKQSNRPFH